MTTDTSVPELSRPVDTQTLPKSGKNCVIDAGMAECTALATRFGVTMIRDLHSRCRLESAAGRDGAPAGARYVLTGTVRAEIVQPCSISLEEVTEQVREEFTIYFINRQPALHPQDEEVEILPDEADVEVLTGTVIDLGEQVVQQLALAINPYPRAVGARGDELGHKILQEDAPSLKEDGKNPFAALKSLKLKT